MAVITLSKSFTPILIIFILVISTISVPQRREFLSFFIISGLSVFFLAKSLRVAVSCIISSGIVMAVIVSLYADQHFYYKVRQTGHAMQNFDNSWTGRAWLWKVALDKIIENPIHGHGYGANTSIVQSYLYEIGIPYYKVRIHNTYLKVMLETGLIGFNLHYNDNSYVTLFLPSFKNF